ncbi:hypothetical protein ScPMuIL_006566 [Solemya velum]
MRTLAQNSSTWTFNIPKKSFLSFSPDLLNGQNQHLSLSFRTHRFNCLLFCHFVDKYDAKKFPYLRNYQLSAEIQQGMLHITYNLNEYTDNLILGSGLNDDHWHNLDISLDTVLGDIAVKLDKHTRSQKLRAYVWSNPAEIIDWTKLSTVISYGGYENPTHQNYHYFIGCMRNLRYQRPDDLFSEVPIHTMKAVLPGCSNKCQEDNLCENGAECVNKYSEVTCNCYGTEFEGEHCENSGVTQVTLSGHDWITYRLYENEEDRLLSDKNIISLEFKTERKSGVLIYAVGGTPYHSHVTASVHNSVVKVSLAIGEEDIDVTMGIKVDDTSWHNLTIYQDGTNVQMQLDNTVKRKRIRGGRRFLSLDPKIFFGGGDNFVVTRGLQVTTNFLGCLRNVYVNDISVLHGLKTGDSRCHHNGGVGPKFGCHTIRDIPVSFPKHATMMRLKEDVSSYLELSLEFRTVRSDAVVFYIDLVVANFDDGYDFGYIEVWIKGNQPMMHFVPSTQDLNSTQNITIPTTVNNNAWHSLNFIFNNRVTKLKVDEISVTSKEHFRPLEHDGMIVIGYGHGRYKVTDGFVGCIRNIQIGERVIDPVSTLLDTSSSIGLLLDGCNLVDHCQTNNLCKHEGRCLSDWDGVSCDCSGTAYEGKACFFSKFRRTCDDYYQAGNTSSGVYQIDLDGSGPLPPNYVQCVMGVSRAGHKFGMTVVEHNLEPNTTIRGTGLVDLRKVISYRQMNSEELIALANLSGWCKQYIQYDCFNAPIKLGEMTWFQGANGEMVDYLGTSESGHCSCTLDQSCPDRKCRCDSGRHTWDRDSGFNNIKRQLPVTEVTVKQNSQSNPGYAKLSLDPLKCWGNKNQVPETSVTFLKEDSYLLVEPWRTGPLEIGFRSHQTNSLVFFQSSKSNSDYIEVKIASARRLTFVFGLDSKDVVIPVRMPYDISDGQWHQIIIEHDEYNIRCSIDMVTHIVQLERTISHSLNFDGILYVGGRPDGISYDRSDRTIGFVGCLRGLSHNHEYHDLIKAIDSSMPDIIFGCVASCQPNPCQNGATCVERWGARECLCVNKWAHTGYNCEWDINDDAVTFSGEPSSYLTLNATDNIGALDETIVLSFRTYQPEALLLYMYDELNNFLQLEVVDGNKLRIKYNQFNTIVPETLMIKDLSDGNWKQVVVEMLDNGYTKIIVEHDSQSKIVPYRRSKLFEYSVNPFGAAETVNPQRSRTKSKEFTRLYVGGVEPGMTDIPSLRGCIRGLKIGTVIYDLMETAKMSPDVVSACDNGCIPNPCRHGGYCLDHWQDKKFECDCSDINYAGDTCEIASSGAFNGNTVLKYSYEPKGRARRTFTETLTVTFRVDSKEDREMILAAIYSETSDDYVLVYINPAKGVFIQNRMKFAIHGVGKSGNYSDGGIHRLIYKRGNNTMILTLDNESMARVDVPANALDGLDTILVGGIVGTEIFSKQANYDNFTGCITDFLFFPVESRSSGIRPLRELIDLKNGSITVYGDDIEVCDKKEEIIYVPTTSSSILSAVTPTMKLKGRTVTMPPWNPGPAETIYIGGPPVLRTSSEMTMPPEVTTTTSTIKPTPDFNQTHAIVQPPSPDNKTIIIAISLVIFAVLLAIIIAIILGRLHRRQTYMLKKSHDDMEMKQPLNQKTPMSPVVSINVADTNHTNHIATLDEFSMVSALLGSSKKSKPEANNVNPKNRFSYSSIPMIDEDQNYAGPQIFNRKKNRPASSISEVLEEMERQKKARELGVSPDDVECSPRSSTGQQHGDGELEWDPQIDKSPLSCVHLQDTIYEKDENETPASSAVKSESSSSNAPSERSSERSSESSSPSSALKSVNSSVVLSETNEHNGDSGYEAESKPDPEDPLLDNGTNDTNDNISPLTPDGKIYMYDISTLDDSPEMTFTPKTRLIENDHVEDT